MTELKPCAHCGSEKIGYSTKVASRMRGESKYHVAMYCKECHCYGPRTLVVTTEKIYGKGLERYRKVAIEAWNRRVNDAE